MDLMDSCLSIFMPIQAVTISACMVMKKYHHKVNIARIFERYVCFYDFSSSTHSIVNSNHEL